MTTASTHPERHRAYRSRLRARGLRQVVLWVPDSRRPGFPEELRRQLSLVETGEEDRDSLALIDAAADWGE